MAQDVDPRVEIKILRHVLRVDLYAIDATPAHPTHCLLAHRLIQFEDFESSVAQPLLDRYRDKILCFNDDIQGTGATVLAGVLACLRQTGKTAQDLKDQRIVLCGNQPVTRVHPIILH